MTPGPRYGEALERNDSSGGEWRSNRIFDRTAAMASKHYRERSLRGERSCIACLIYFERAVLFFRWLAINAQGEPARPQRMIDPGTLATPHISSNERELLFLLSALVITHNNQLSNGERERDRETDGVSGDLFSGRRRPAVVSGDRELVMAFSRRRIRRVSIEAGAFCAGRGSARLPTARTSRNASRSS